MGKLLAIFMVLSAIFSMTVSFFAIWAGASYANTSGLSWKKTFHDIIIKPAAMIVGNDILLVFSVSSLILFLVTLSLCYVVFIAAAGFFEKKDR